MIDARVNGAGPYCFIFDSGANAVLSPEVGKQLKLVTTKEQPQKGTGGGRLEAAGANVMALTVASLTLRNQHFDVLSLADMANTFGNLRIDGIIGRPVFSGRIVQIDYDRRRLIVWQDGAFSPRSDYSPVPFTRIRDVPLVEATLDGFRGLFGVDLGARSSLILTKGFVEDNHLAERFILSPNLISGWGLGGAIHSRLARAHLFTVAGFRIEDPLVRLSTQTSGLLSRSDDAGLIGADVLRQFVITFDDVRHIVYFRRSRNFGEPTNFDKSGFWLTDDRLGGFEVLEVVPGGAAERAGVRNGDRIVVIDGRAAEHLTLPSLRDAWAQAAEGTRVTIVITRLSKRIQTVLQLQKIV